MGILHRIYTKHAPEVWQVETRLLHATGRVRRPLAVQWLVTAACDLHCPHCYSEAGRRVANELTTTEAKRLVIDELVALGCKNLVLSGGELWLRRDIPELIAYAASRGLSWSMHTHGLHVPRYREILARFPPVLAAISLDDVGNQHDDFRGRVGSYAGALEGIRVLKEIGCPEVVAGTTVTRRNADRLAALFPVVADSGADAWGLHLFAPEGRGHEHLDLQPTPDQLRRVAAFARRKRRSFHVELCNEWGSAGAEDWLYRDQPFLCGAGRVSCVVGPSGEIMPCTTSDLRESEGNVRERALREVWATGFGRFRKPRALPGTTAARRTKRPLVWLRRKDGATAAGAPDTVGPIDDVIDEQECWLQSRNGNACSEDAFGAERLPSPLRLLDTLLAHRVALRFKPSGAPRIVSSRAAQALRAAAVATVFLQGCATKLKPSPTPGPSPSGERDGATAATVRSTGTSSGASSAPRDIDAAVPSASLPLAFPPELERDPAGHYRHQVGRTAWKQLLRRLVEGPPADGKPTAPHEWAEEARALTARLDARGRLSRRPNGDPAHTQAHAPGGLSQKLAEHIDRREHDRPDTPAELMALLDAAERSPLYDTALAAYLFHRTEPEHASSMGRRALFTRLDAHIRVSEALRLAEQRAGRVELSAWRSKAAPPPDSADRLTLPPGLVDAARDALKTSSAATFRRAGSVSFRVAEGELVLHTQLGPEVKREGETFVLERLFTMTCVSRCALTHAVVGTLVLPAGSEASSYDLPRFLDESGKVTLAKLVDQALENEPGALARLEPVIALAHRLVRARVGVSPPPPAGAAALQMLLTTLDE